MGFDDNWQQSSKASPNSHATAFWAADVRVGNAGKDDETGMDLSIKDVRPLGTTTVFASPEVLISLQKQSQGVPDTQPGVLVNGPAADMWALACVLYEMLTGKLPFMPTEEPKGPAPVTVPEGEPQELWLMYDAVWRVQDQWVSASFHKFS